MLSSKRLMVLLLYLGHWTILVNFCIRNEVGVQLRSFVCRYPVDPGQFMEETLHFPSNDLGTLVENPLAVAIRDYFCTLSSISLTYIRRLYQHHTVLTTVTL